MPRSRFALLLILILGVWPQVGRAGNNNPFYQSNQNEGQMPYFTAWGGSPGTVGAAFVGNAASGGFAGIYSIPKSGGVVITLTGSNFRSVPVGPIVSDGTSIVFRGNDEVIGGPSTGLFSVPIGGGVPLTIRGSGFTDPSFAPAISPNGNIAFKDLMDDGSTPGIFARSSGGGVPLTINGSNFSRMGRPAVNTALNVAFVGSPAGSSVSGVYIQDPSQVAPVPLALSPSLRIAGEQVSIVDSPQGTSVSFFAIDSSTGQRGLYHSDQFTPQGLFSPPQLLTQGSDTAPLGEVFSTNALGYWLSKKGYDYYKARSDLSSALLPTEEIRLIGIGDAVDGSTVADILMTESSLLDNGDAMFHLTLANGVSGLYIVSVPEPGSLSALAISLLALSRRKPRGKYAISRVCVRKSQIRERLLSVSGSAVSA